LTVDQLPAKGSLEKIVSIDVDVIPVVSKDFNNRPGKYTIKVIVDPTNAVLESKETNNTTLSDIVIARAPVPEKEWDPTIVYSESNKDIALKMAHDGPLKPFYDADPAIMAKVFDNLPPIPDANAVYELSSGQKISWGLRNVALVQPEAVGGGWTGRAKVTVSEGILAQVGLTLPREEIAGYYMIKNTSGYTIGAKVGANELLASIAEWYAYTWYAENGIILGGNISYEVNKLQLDTFFSGQGLFSKCARALSALSIDLGYPDGGVPSSVLLQEIMKIISMPDPTNYAQQLFDKAEKLDKNMLKSKAYWNAMVDAPQRMLPLDVCKRISYPSVSAPVSLDAVKAAQDGAIYPK